MATLERGRNAVRGVFFGMLQKLVQILGPFITRTVLIYCLGMDYLGLNGLFTSVLQVLNLAELGVGSAMIFSMYKPIAEDNDKTLCALMRLYRTYYRLIGMVVLVVGLILMPFLPYLIAGNIPQDMNLYLLYLLNLAATVLSYWLFAYRNSLLNAYQRMDIVSKVTLITSLLQYVLQVVVVVLFKNYYLFVVVALFVQILNNILTALTTRKMYPALKPVGLISKSERKTINGKIRDLFTGQLGYVITTAGNSLVVSAFLGLVTLGIYQNYMLIMTSIASVFTIIYNAMQAGIGNAIILETTENNYKRFDAVAFVIFFCIALASGCMAGLIQPFMCIWVGQGAMLDTFAVACLVAYFVAYEIVMLFSMFKNAAGIWKPDRFRPAVSGLINIVMSVILVRVADVDGILFALALTTWLISVAWIIRNSFTYVLKVPFLFWASKFIGYVAIIVVGSVLSYCVCMIIPIGGVIGLLVKLIAAVIISLVVFVVPSLWNISLLDAVQMVNAALSGRLAFVVTAIEIIQNALKIKHA